MKSPFEFHPYVAIEGNIGSGKTTLANMLSQRFDQELILEEFEENPYLARFYKDRDRYAFQLELNFLADRFRQFKHRIPGPSLFTESMISDYTIDKCLIFAQLNLRREEYTMYRKIHRILTKGLPRPELTIYLYARPERLLSNIQKRGRSFETDIKEDYLEGLNHAYLKFFREHPEQTVLILELGEHDFVENVETFDKIVSICSKKFKKGLHQISL
ncbi:deoxynucleoside kinase [Salibacteraceae bacterium]|jgi:deoxyadenosine/deoxycytidine kinase|nr:deoxynucleoside kinase [Salibacteraceae bacterium]